MTKTILNQEYLSVLTEIKNEVKTAQYKATVRVNNELIRLYWNIGKKLFSQISINNWGKAVVQNLSQDLQIEFPGVKGFSPANLWYMKQFYEAYEQNEKLQQLVGEIPWGQNIMIFSHIKTDEEKEFYLNQTIRNSWSRATLEENIKFDLFHKTPIQNNFSKTLSINKKAELALEFKDDYNLSFLGLTEEHNEKTLESELVKQITKTLGQFGTDFAFMGRQFRLEVSDKEYFVDLLFYHRKLKRLVAIELKTVEFKPEHSQQLNWYLHLLDKQVKYEDDETSIGILICRSKDKVVVEYALELANHPIGVATYTYQALPKSISKYLPDEQTLTQLFR